MRIDHDLFVVSAKNANFRSWRVAARTTEAMLCRLDATLSWCYWVVQGPTCLVVVEGLSAGCGAGVSPAHESTATLGLTSHEPLSLHDPVIRVENAKKGLSSVGRLQHNNQLCVVDFTTHRTTDCETLPHEESK